jgi:thioredoxin 1
MSIINSTDASFEADVLKADTPVLVDFWAPWCGPCKMIGPILEQLVTEVGDKVKIVKVNVDENMDVPAKFGVRGIPTLMIFNDGVLKATKVGAVNKGTIQSFIDTNI